MLPVVLRHNYPFLFLSLLFVTFPIKLTTVVRNAVWFGSVSCPARQTPPFTAHWRINFNRNSVVFNQQSWETKSDLSMYDCAKCTCAFILTYGVTSASVEADCRHAGECISRRCYCTTAALQRVNAWLNRCLVISTVCFITLMACCNKGSEWIVS